MIKFPLCKIVHNRRAMPWHAKGLGGLAIVGSLVLLTACAAFTHIQTPSSVEAHPSPSRTAERHTPTITVSPTPTSTPKPERTTTPTEPLSIATPSPSPPLSEQDLGLSAGTERLVAALQPPEGELVAFEKATLSDGTPAWVWQSPDGKIRFEIIGPEDSPITASVVALLPEGDAQAREEAIQALYRLIQAAMPERAWARAWLDERLEAALSGIPFSATRQGYYVQIVQLDSPQPYIYLAVTLDPRTLSLPQWEANLPGQDIPWNYLPIMPGATHQQRIPTDRFTMLEYLADRALQEVEAFYEEEMRHANWERVERAVVGDPANQEQYQVVMVYRRGTEGAIITLEPLPTGRKTLVTLGYTEDAADLPAIAG